MVRGLATRGHGIDLEIIRLLPHIELRCQDFASRNARPQGREHKNSEVSID